MRDNLPSENAGFIEGGTMTCLTKWLPALTAAGILVSGSIPALSEYPDRAIHFIVGFAPGGGADVAARVIAAGLSEKLGQPIVVENKPGAAASIAADFVAHAKPDGYTFDFMGAAHTITPSLMKLTYDPVKSFAPVGESVIVPEVIVVGANSPVKTLKDLLAMAKAKPGTINFGDAGYGAPTYLEMMTLMKVAGVNLTHVAFKGGNEAAIAIIGGEVQTGFAAIGSISGQLKNGQLRALASSTIERPPMMPEIPTVAEALGLKTFDAANADWDGLLAPAGTPKEIVDKMNNAMTDVVNSPKTKAKLLEIGFVPVARNSPAEFTKLIADDIARWAPMLKEEPVK